VTPSDSGTTRSELARACRVLDAASLSCGTWGFLARRDDLGRGVWSTRDGVGFDEITNEDLLLLGPSGEVVRGEGEPDSEVSLALEIMAVRSDVHAVVHAHSLYATAFAATERPLQAISHEGCHLVPPGVARDDVARRSEGGEGLAVSLGTRNSILMPGHGLVSVAETVGEAVALAVYLEKACQLQLLSGDDVHVVPDVEVMEKRSGQLKRPQISWHYLERVAP
jgi:ribulose-5-phosphate 4-epimerase/fuculose-1-phosphate aldolase